MGENPEMSEKRRLAEEAVKNIIKPAVAWVTSGKTPISFIRGPLTIPPPTPNIPAKSPAVEQTRGYRMALFVSHLTSPSCHGYPISSFTSVMYIKSKAT